MDGRYSRGTNPCMQTPCRGTGKKTRDVYRAIRAHELSDSVGYPFSDRAHENSPANRRK